ncbi:MAG: sulfatase [Candidatus Hydrogenedentes bacterium]|nr:sulfatase [Candidatus Hydrogenedentota bacterium]
MAAVTAPAWALAQENARPTRGQERPNLVFVFADQWRAQATGYGGDSNLRTPHLDELAAESIDFRNAVASCPVCSPYRGSLLTGMYPDQHGVFVNDVHLRDEFPSIGDQLQEAGYFTGWIGKWHVNGRGRSAFIPPEERQGFQLWMTMECTHDYNNSWYYKDTPEKLKWEGYDAFAQTRAATRFIAEYQEDKPFALFLSWGPPHNPYNTAPAEYRRQFEAAELVLRGNVPADHEAAARLDLADYYAHCAALDACLGEIMQALRAAGLEENTVLVFTSDHGDMLESQGEQRKQRPWDESIRVPFLLRWPGRFGRSARTIEAPLGTPDLMPTLLELCHASVPDSVQGQSLVPWLEGAAPEDRGALIACYTPFGEWTRAKGGREYRGIRTRRYSYVCDLNGPWLLYDNDADPFQLKNLCGAAGQTDAQTRLDMDLKTLLRELGDEFLPGDEYLRRWGYKVDATGTVPYKA